MNTLQKVLLLVSLVAVPAGAESFFAKPKAPAIDAAALDARIGQLERTLADEGTRNEYVFHGAIHERLAVELEPANPEENAHTFAGLDRWLYDEVFLTPSSDPWLGLAAVDTLTGLPDDGLKIDGQHP